MKAVFLTVEQKFVTVVALEFIILKMSLCSKIYINADKLYFPLCSANDCVLNRCFVDFLIDYSLIDDFFF